jgi:predicted nucleotidyltransferase
VRTAPDECLNLDENGQDAISHLTDAERRAATEFVDKVRQQFDDQVISVVLFGSRARGEADPDSDMDLLVVMYAVDLGTRRAIRYLAVEVGLEHDIYLSTRVWDLAHWRKLEGLQTFFYRNICKDGVNLYGQRISHVHGSPNSTTNAGARQRNIAHRPA